MSNYSSVTEILDAEVEYRLRQMGVGLGGKYPAAGNKVTRPLFKALVRECGIPVSLIDITCRTCHGVGHLFEGATSWNVSREVPCPLCQGNGLESVWNRADD
jgi:hypothetical protein